MMEGDDYFEMTENQALWAAVEHMRAALRALDDGRNQDCWPLGSFGGKDADLDAEGCTGIKAIEDATETADGWLLQVQIGGHKTFCDPTEAAEVALDEEARAMWRECARRYVVDACAHYSGHFHCEWTGEEWVGSHEETLAVPFTLDDDPAETAARIVAQARGALNGFAQAMAAGDRDLNRLYEEMHGRRPDDADDYDA